VLAFGDGLINYGGLGQLILGNAKRCDLSPTAAREQDFNLLLGALKRGLTVAGQLDAPLEGLERFIQRQVAAAPRIEGHASAHPQPRSTFSRRFLW